MIEEGEKKSLKGKAEKWLAAFGGGIGYL